MADGTSARVTPIVIAQATASARISQTLTGLVAAYVRQFTGWYSTQQITTWAAELAAVMESGQRTTAATTDAYLTRVASATTGRPQRPAGAINVTDLRAGVTHPGAYGRVADQVRWELSTGVDEPTALEHAVERAQAIAETDLQLADRAQAQATLKATKAEGWRRVLHPELVSSNSKDGVPGDVCGMCVAASDRVYRVDTLKALHGGCRCSVMGIYGGNDPGADINRADLERIYRDAGNTTAAAALYRTSYVVHMHPELGPVLAERGKHWRSPTQVKRSRRQAV